METPKKITRFAIFIYYQMHCFYAAAVQKSSRNEKILILLAAF